MAGHWPSDAAVSLLEIREGGNESGIVIPRLVASVAKSLNHSALSSAEFNAEIAIMRS
jgi:hypothetical protein